MININNRQPDIDVGEVETQAELISIYNEIDEGTAQEVVDYFSEQIVAGKLTGQNKHWTAYQQRLARFIVDGDDTKQEFPSLFDDVPEYGYFGHKNLKTDIGLVKYLYLHYQLEQAEHQIGYQPSHHVVSTCQKYTKKHSTVVSPSSFSPNRDIDFRIEAENTITVQLEEWFVKDNVTTMLCSSQYGPLYIDMPAFCPARYVIKEKLQGKNGYPIRVDRLRPRYNLAGDTAHIIVGNWELI